MTNYRTDRPTKLRVTLESLNLASRRYRMQRLPGQLGDEPGSPSVQLGWQERVTVHYRIVPREQNSTTCCLSQCRFEELEETDGNFDSLDCAGTRTTDFICLENAHDDFKVSWFSFHNLGDTFDAYSWFVFSFRQLLRLTRLHFLGRMQIKTRRVSNLEQSPKSAGRTQV
jgi:hypothetical protein